MTRAWFVLEAGAAVEINSNLSIRNLVRDKGGQPIRHLRDCEGRPRDGLIYHKAGADPDNDSEKEESSPITLRSRIL